MNARKAAAAIIAIIALAGVAVAANRYFYLSDQLNTDVTMTKGELGALQLTAYYNNTGALTSKLVRQSLRAYLSSLSLDVFVDTAVQDSWPVHTGGSSFSISDAELSLAYIEAGEVVLGWVNRYFPDINIRAVNIIFTIKGFKMGTYQQGKFTIQR